MAPQNIDDLPRHEEPRELMLGLIDDLPDRQERRGARQLMMWGLGLSGQNASGEPKSDYAQNVGRLSR